MFILGWGSGSLWASARGSITNRLVMSGRNRGSNKAAGALVGLMSVFCWKASSTTRSWGGVGRLWTNWWALTWERRLACHGDWECLWGSGSPLKMHWWTYTPKTQRSRTLSVTLRRSSSHTKRLEPRLSQPQTTLWLALPHAWPQINPWLTQLIPMTQQKTVRALADAKVTYTTKWERKCRWVIPSALSITLCLPAMTVHLPH